MAFAGVSLHVIQAPPEEYTSSSERSDIERRTDGAAQDTFSDCSEMDSSSSSGLRRRGPTLDLGPAVADESLGISFGVEETLRSLTPEEITECHEKVVSFIAGLPVEASLRVDDLNCILEEGERLVDELHAAVDGIDEVSESATNRAILPLKHLVNLLKTVSHMLQAQQAHAGAYDPIPSVSLPIEMKELTRRATESGPLFGEQALHIIGSGGFGRVSTSPDFPALVRKEHFSTSFKAVYKEAAFSLLTRFVVDVPCFHIADEGCPTTYMSYIPPVEITAQHMNQMLQKLALLHQHGIVHGDIKPQNVVQSDLIDFGCSRFVFEEGRIGGTTLFKPPWLLTVSEGPVTPAFDIWSFGVSLYKRLTGRHFLKEVLKEKPLEGFNLDAAHAHLSDKARIDEIIDSRSFTEPQKAFFKMILQPTSEDTPSLEEIMASGEYSAFYEEILHIEDLDRAAGLT